jgi:hypothetical protein
MLFLSEVDSKRIVKLCHDWQWQKHVLVFEWLISYVRNGALLTVIWHTARVRINDSLIFQLKIIHKKAIRVIGHGGPYSFETSRLPHFLDNRLSGCGEPYVMWRRYFMFRITYVQKRTWSWTVIRQRFGRRRSWSGQILHQVARQNLPTV